jgi:hypothetical protein
LLTARLHRVNFYLVPRKLIAKLQSFSKSIQETPMVRFYSSINPNDEMLVVPMSCDSVLHGNPHQTAAATSNETECLGSVPDPLSLN